MMKLKLLTLGATTLLSAGLAHASGLYVGGTVGTLSLTSRHDLHIGPIEVDSAGSGFPDIQIDSATTLGDTGYGGRFFTGYMFDLVKKFSVAIEANLEFNTASVDTGTSLSISPIIETISLLNTQLDVKNSYGLSLLPTYHISDDFLVFARAGIARGTIHSNAVGALTNVNDSFNRMGGQLGLGMEYALSKHLSLRGEYIYTSYKSIDQSFAPGVTIPNSFGIKFPIDLNNSVHTSAFGIGFTYRI